MIFVALWLPVVIVAVEARVSLQREVNTTKLVPATSLHPKLTRTGKHDNARQNLSETVTKPYETGGSFTWGYDENDGPAHWPVACRLGRRQSPIDIDTRHVMRIEVASLHFTNYERLFEDVQAENNGHSIVFTGFDRDPSTAPYVEGGGLRGRYILQQFHFHWSHRFSNGSEHTINKHHYPVEIHMVHIRANKKLAEALNDNNNNSIAVLAVLGMIGEDGVAFDGIARKFPDFPGDRLTVKFRPSHLLPADTSDFFRYDGSLTTPGCAETVAWVVFHEPIPITVEQLAALRLVNFADRADADTRPVQPINGRRVLSCHSSGIDVF